MKDHEQQDGFQAGYANPWAIAKRAIELIKQHGCVPSPKAYEVFFGYADGLQAVRDQVDIAAQDDGLLTAFDLDRIHHDNFRSNSGEWERQQRASMDIEDSIRTAVAGIEDHARIGADYERRLAEASGRLVRTSSPDDVSDVVRSLVEDTDAARVASEAMRSSLLRTRNTVSEVTAEVSASRVVGTKDLLTDLMSRRGFDVTLQANMEAARRSGIQIMLCYFAMDDFGPVNEAHGRQAGDLVIRSIGRMVRRFANGDDVAARVGGVKFAMLMKGCSLREAVTTAEAMRTELSKRRFAPPGAEDGIGPLLASFGVAIMSNRDRADDLFARAARNAEEARTRGGNRVVSDPGQGL